MFKSVWPYACSEFMQCSLTWIPNIDSQLHISLIAITFLYDSISERELELNPHVLESAHIVQQWKSLTMEM